jgi:hypothetical protein
VAVVAGKMISLKAAEAMRVSQKKLSLLFQN